MKTFERTYLKKTFILSFFAGIMTLSSFCQQSKIINNDSSHLVSGAEAEKLLSVKAPCMEGYLSNQSGPLYKIGTNDDEPDDSTFTVEKIKIKSDSVMINGWLYLPLGEGTFPLTVLTNGGGDGSRAIKSLSDWIAPILSHCGIAAFVHDKRGTGESGGDFAKTTYDDYITDAGNCAIFLSEHKRINPEMIGVLGGSEGGRVAVIAASRFPVFKFVVSYAGTVVSAVDDRINAQTGWLKSLKLPDSTYAEVLSLHKKSIRAWAGNSAAEHEKVNREIFEMRKKYDSELLPFTKQEMDSIPDFKVGLPTWYSLPSDYMSEMERFNKKWLAIFGEIDQVVPTQASVENILHYMKISGNNDYKIVVIPKCGHAPVNTETKRMVRLENIILNWLKENGIGK